MRNPYAAGRVTPGEHLAGTVMDPISLTDLEVWHFQDDAVTGEVLVYEDFEDIFVDQMFLWETYYLFWSPFCPSIVEGVDGPDGIQDHSKDLAFELLTIDCFDSTHADYPIWVQVGKPLCWCTLYSYNRF